MVSPRSQVMQKPPAPYVDGPAQYLGPALTAKVIRQAHFSLYAAVGDMHCTGSNNIST
jgi:hypothetical protein